MSSAPSIPQPGMWADAQDTSDAPHARRVPPSDASRLALERLNRLRNLSRLMDSSFQVPGLGIKFGLDPIVGVVPVLGDAVAAVVSLYILHQARTLGVSTSTLWKMFANIAIDFLVGEIPALGDVFDLVFKANQRNIKLIEQDLAARGLL
jgi:Domain of unknown function (DUF4112)